MAQLNQPAELTIDSRGRLYIVDRNNHCVRRVLFKRQLNLDSLGIE